jgi:glycosyltransferase involved in cell wall biosynthesis
VIPPVAHFVFGLREQDEPFHFLHYVSLESCRRVLEPETIYFHHKQLPWGPWWERVRPHLTLVEVDHAPEVEAADYSAGHVPPQYRYAHHADFIRLDALIERGGVYADIDTIFVRRFPDDLFTAPFVIGREPAARHESTGERRPSLCNALLMAEPGAPFAVAWRERVAAALDGTWSNHSGFVSEELSRTMPAAVRVEPQVSFFTFGPDPADLARLLQERHTLPDEALSVHLWAHLWWDRRRRDFSQAHAGWCTPQFILAARTTLAEIVRPYVPDRPGTGTGPRRAGSRTVPSSGRWSYLSLDEPSGYGVAAERCIMALEDFGLDLDWTPFVPGGGWGLGYEPVPSLGAFASSGDSARVVIAHLTPEYLPLARQRCPDAFLVAHTVWETDRLPEHWTACLDQADLIVVPSRLSAEAIATSPVAAPVVVVPHVAASVTTSPSPADAEIADDVFVFYTLGEWNERKAVFKTIEAYLRAFTRQDQVLLIVKTSYLDRRLAPLAGSGVSGRGTTAWSLAQLLARHPDPPAVRLITRELTHDQISDLHRRGDCFVSLCRGEGWGLGAFDAAAHGNPVVITGFGGQLDYLADSPGLVDFDLVPVHDPAGFPSYAPDQRWAEPDIDHGADLLRGVYADPRQAAAVASTIAQTIRWRYRPAAIATAFSSAVAQYTDRRERHSTQAATPPR